MAWAAQPIESQVRKRLLLAHCRPTMAHPLFLRSLYANRLRSHCLHPGAHACGFSEKDQFMCIALPMPTCTNCFRITGDEATQTRVGLRLRAEITCTILLTVACALLRCAPLAGASTIARICKSALGEKVRLYVPDSVHHCTSGSLVGMAFWVNVGNEERAILSGIVHLAKR